MIDIFDTIDFDDVIFIDTETRSDADQPNPKWENVTQSSAYPYAGGAWPIVITWARGLDGPVQTWAPKDITRRPDIVDIPSELHAWAVTQDCYFMAFNSQFDRLIMEPYLMRGRWISPWLDARVQAAYNSLPLALDRATKATGLKGKVAAGKQLIQLFCTPGGATPEERPDEWAQFLEYAKVDVEQMQALCAATFPVPRSVWEEFWVSETINDRGLPIDIGMARGGAKLAAELEADMKRRVKEVTGNDLHSIRQYQAQRDWVWERVRGNPKVAGAMIKAQRENPDTGETEYKLEMDRPVITRMIAALEQTDKEIGLTDDELEALELLELREFGASAAPFKFQKILDQADRDGLRLPGQYIFFGATATRRYSSWGVQVHNMTRSVVGSLAREEELCMVLAERGHSLKEFEDTYGDAGKNLARLIRPTIAASEGRMLVWADSSNIEARGLPWLAKAQGRLDMFRAIDADPKNVPDVYIQSVAGMYDLDAYELMRRRQEKDPEAGSLRQRGKVAELALGFGGGVGALQSMAAGYGMAFEDDEAKDIVERWRAANQWCVSFWDGLLEAFSNAASQPGDTRFVVGQVAYQGVKVGGQTWVFCWLPNGLPLIYRNVKYRTDVEVDPFDPAIILSKESKLSFEGAEGLKWVWRGLLAENITQAACGCVLRDAIQWLVVDARVDVVGHTHDEILVECDDHPGEIADARAKLCTALLRDPGWHPDLPLGVDVTVHPWYSKAVED